MTSYGEITLKIAYLALGSNLGKRIENLKSSLEMLDDEQEISVAKVSPVYETAPVGGPEQGSFLNACAALETDLPPEKLLLKMLHTEDEMGRVREERWGPRLIDLDLLVYENEIVNTELLELPHPRLAERGFVLVPLADIAPGLIVPGYNKTVSELLLLLPDIKGISLFLPGSWFKR